MRLDQTAPGIGRRTLLAGAASCLAAPALAVVGGGRRFRIAFANLSEDASVRLEGLGFSGTDVRRSFELAARTLPVDIVPFDNNNDAATMVANADAAIAQKVDLFIAYGSDADANAEIGGKLKSAGIACLALNYPVPGAPLYTADNYVAGRLGGEALGRIAKSDWKDEPVAAVVAGDLGDVGPAVTERVRGLVEGLHRELPDVRPASLDTSGNPIRMEGLLKKYLATLSREKVLIATLDDATALAAKGGLDLLQRSNDGAICGQGMDRALHGGAGDKREIDPANRGSSIVGSVAYFMDRYGYEVLPLALKMLRGEQVQARTTTNHVLVTAQNVFSIYPPTDMN